MKKITKSLSADFPRGLIVHQLVRDVVNAGVEICSYCDIVGDAVNLYFVDDPTSYISTINTIIGNYYQEPMCFDGINFITITSANSPYQMTNNSVKCDTSSGNIIVTLPKVQRAKNAVFAIQKISPSNTVTINPRAPDLINGASSATLTTMKSSLVLTNDSQNWYNYGADYTTDTPSLISVNTGDILVDNGTELQPLSVGANGQVIIADSTQPLGVRWATLTASGFTSTSSEVTATAIATTTSTTYVLLTGMSVTPAAGTYVAMFSSSGSSTSASAIVNYSIYVGGSIVAASERSLRAATSTTNPLYTQAKVTVNGSQAIEIRVKTTTGTFTINTRSLLIIGVA